MQYLSNKTLRAICTHCHAVLEYELPAEPGGIICAACDEEQIVTGDGAAGVGGTLNAAAPNLTAISKLTVSPSLDTVFVQSIAIFPAHVAILLTASLAANLIWFAIIGFPVDALVSLWREVLGGSAGDAKLLAMTLGGTGLVGVLIAPVSAYCMIVMVRLVLRIARYGLSVSDDGRLRRVLFALSVPGSTVLRLSGLFLIVGMLFAGLLGLCLVLIIAFSFAYDPNTVTWIGTLAMGAVVIVTVFLLQWLLWPAVFLIADGRTDLATGVLWSMRLTWRNRKLTLSLVTVYFILATAGSMLFYVGQIVTTPLAMLPMAIGYLRITGGQMAASCKN